MFKRWMALVLASATVLTLAACGGKEETETTKNNDKEVVATDVVTNKVGETINDTAVETQENAEAEDKKTEKDDKETTEKSDSDTTKKSDDKETTKKSDSDKKTTKKKDTDKKTTKAEDTFKIPSSKADIVNAYKNAANKTKAQDNMKVDKTCDVDISIDNFAGSTVLTKLANKIAAKFMNQASGKVEKEVFKGGKPTLKTEVKNGKLVNDKDTFIPIYGKKELCTLNPANVKSAEVTKKTNNSYDVKIVLKDDSCSINGVPKITVSGMDYFNPKLYTEDLEGLSFSKGTVYYTECVITATVNADGYIDYVKHDMKLKTDDTVVRAIGIDIDAALSGRYVTTFKFY